MLCLHVSGSQTMNKLLTTKFETNMSTLKENLKRVRTTTICIDCWTKKGLTSSYLGISACYFDPDHYEVCHATLDVVQVEHPHTGQSLARLITRTLTEWGLGKEKVLLVISDNGANMKKAVRLMQEEAKQNENNDVDEEVEDDDELELPDRGDLQVEVESEDDDDEDEGETGEIEETAGNEEYFLSEVDLPYRHMRCLAHTIQLLIKPAMKVQYGQVLMAARRVVSKIRKSSIMTQELCKLCGKILTIDCPTRWNSTFGMCERLLSIRAPIEEVLEKNKIDCLRNSEWAKLQEMMDLLQPFANQTDTLQSDGRSLSLIVPALLDLDAHISNFPVKTISRVLADDFKARFASFLQPGSPNFNPLPAAATLLDPTVAGKCLTFSQLSQLPHLLPSIRTILHNVQYKSRLSLTNVLLVLKDKLLNNN